MDAFFLVSQDIIICIYRAHIRGACKKKGGGGKYVWCKWTGFVRSWNVTEIRKITLQASHLVLNIMLCGRWLRQAPSYVVRCAKANTPTSIPCTYIVFLLRFQCIVSTPRVNGSDVTLTHFAYLVLHQGAGNNNYASSPSQEKVKCFWQ